MPQTTQAICFCHSNSFLAGSLSRNPISLEPRASSLEQETQSSRPYYNSSIIPNSPVTVHFSGLYRNTILQLIKTLTDANQNNFIHNACNVCIHRWPEFLLYPGNVQCHEEDAGNCVYRNP